MSSRIGPGPVFVYESLIFSRRRQVYAGRGLFVLALLIGLWSAWWSNLNEPVIGAPVGTRPGTWKALANAGRSFFSALAGIQLTMVLLVAPAATAGAICHDRARGILAQMATTDLSAAEIVLGKLFSRLGPILALLACALPVSALAALLGGIDIQALFSLFAVSVAVAVLGCALALLVSVQAARTQDAIMAVLALWTCWLMSLPIWSEIWRASADIPRRRTGSRRPIPTCWCTRRTPGRATSVCSTSRSSWPGRWRSRPDWPRWRSCGCPTPCSRSRPPAVGGDGGPSRCTSRRSTGGWRGCRAPSSTATPCSGASGIATGRRG